MRSFLIKSALAMTVACTALPLSGAGARAQDVQLELGRDGPQLRLRQDCDPQFEDCYAGERDVQDRGMRHGCSEERALDKAERMGIRRARIDDAGRRTIDVRGRDRSGERVILTFARSPGCPLLN